MDAQAKKQFFEVTTGCPTIALLIMPRLSMCAAESLHGKELFSDFPDACKALEYLSQIAARSVLPDDTVTFFVCRGLAQTTLQQASAFLSASASASLYGFSFLVLNVALALFV